jgi:hypothetical protein
MDSVSIVVTALVAGAAAGVSGAASAAVLDAYQGLKSLVLKCLRGGGVDDGRAQELVDKTSDQEAGREAISAELARIGVDEPTEQAAKQLLELLKTKGKYNVTITDSKGVIVGDHVVQHNTFNN